MNSEQACSVCGSSPIPFEEARYFCKICKQHTASHAVSGTAAGTSRL
ncbi:MAG TPA: hypothetical protein VNI77_06745 [Nitrososphaera sp.]|nr:hypothetical protein [Nitrososphaera sp.]